MNPALSRWSESVFIKKEAKKGFPCLKKPAGVINLHEKNKQKIKQYGCVKCCVCGKKILPALSEETIFGTICQECLENEK